MALKMGKLGTYSKDNANTYANPTIRFDDGLLRRSDFVGNPQTQFVNNMQKDPGLTLATTIGGLLGSYVGSNVEQNGIRKGTEMAQSMLDNMKSSGRLDGRNYAVEENGMISLNNPDAKSTLNGAIDYSATSPAPGIGIVQDYMSKYANEPNPIQYQNDMNRATDFVKQSEGQLFANATPDEVRNMIRRQAIAEGRSSQQIDKIMSNIDPEINASYNKYMDEKDAGNYTAALGYLKEGRFQDAMNLASQINNPKLLQALNTAGNYAMQEENLRLKRDALDAKAAGKGNGVTPAVVSQQPPYQSRKISTYTPLYQRYWDTLGKDPKGSLLTEWVEMPDGTQVKKQAIYDDKKMYEDKMIDLGNPDEFNKYLNNGYEMTSKIFNGSDNRVDGFNHPELIPLLKDNEYKYALYNRLRDNGVNVRDDEDLRTAYTRIENEKSSAQRQAREKAKAEQAAQDAAKEREQSARTIAFNNYLRMNHPELTSQYFNGLSPYRSRDLTQDESQAAQRWVEENYRHYMN